MEADCDKKLRRDQICPEVLTLFPYHFPNTPNHLFAEYPPNFLGKIEKKHGNGANIAGQDGAMVIKLPIRIL